MSGGVTAVRAVTAVCFALCVTLGLTLAGCGQQPQKIEVQPTPSKASAAATPTSLVPEYTSKKKLTPAEKKAAEDALVVLDGYNKEVVSIYQRGGKGTSVLRPIVTSSHLKVIDDEMKAWKSQKLHMEGSYSLSNRVVTNAIAKAIDKSTKGWVRIEACVPFETTKLVNAKGEVQKQWATSARTISFVIVLRDAKWQVDDTGTEANRC